MDSNILVALISGIFSVVSALGAVLLKDYLDTRRYRQGETQLENAHPKTSPEQPSPASAPSKLSTGGHTLNRPVVIVIGSFLFGMGTRALRPLFTGDIHFESLAALTVQSSILHLSSA